MSCSRALVISLILAVLLIVSIFGIWFFVFHKSDDVNDDENLSTSSRLHLSSYDPSARDYFVIGKANTSEIISNIDDFLKPYDMKNTKYEACDWAKKQSEDKTCGVDVSRWACKKSGNFGLNKDADSFRPCIFLKFDADTEWKPEFYDVDDLPENMPKDLISSIKSVTHGNKRNIQTLWVSCEGVSEEDKSNVGTISFFPNHGFLGYYFPCKSEELCTDPLISILLSSSSLKKNVEINVQCQVWAKNADDKVTFKVFIEE